ncbi:MAG: hypothetical protein LBP98_02845 [Tannerella sp.]|nr:hypothetical protein [Tannerella sp.]
MRRMMTDESMSVTTGMVSGSRGVVGVVSGTVIPRFTRSSSVTFSL